MIQLVVLSILLNVWECTCQSTDVDVSMGRIPSVILMSAGYGLAYQKRFEAIREMRATQCLNRSGWNMSGLKVVQLMMGGVTRGPTRMTPCGQASEGARDRKLPQCPSQHVHSCLDRGGRAEIVPWSSSV